MASSFVIKIALLVSVVPQSFVLWYFDPDFVLQTYSVDSGMPPLVMAAPAIPDELSVKTSFSFTTVTSQLCGIPFMMAVTVADPWLMGDTRPLSTRTTFLSDVLHSTVTLEVT